MQHIARRRSRSESVGVVTALSPRKRIDMIDELFDGDAASLSAFVIVIVVREAQRDAARVDFNVDVLGDVRSDFRSAPFPFWNLGQIDVVEVGVCGLVDVLGNVRRVWAQDTTGGVHGALDVVAHVMWCW